LANTLIFIKIPHPILHLQHPKHPPGLGESVSLYLCLSICFFYGLGCRASTRAEHVLHVEDVGHLLGT